MRRLLSVLGACVILCGIAVPASAQVTLDAVATGATDSGTGVTAVNNTLQTVGVGSNRCLVVSLDWDRTTISAVSVVWDCADAGACAVGGTNQQMTQIVAINATNSSSRSELWGLVAPTSGNKTLRVKWTTAAEVIVDSVAWAGCDQTGSTITFAHSTSAAATGASPSIAITSVVNNQTVANLAVGAATPSTQTQTALLGQPVSGAGATNSDVTRAVGAASVTHGFTVTSNPYAITGTDVCAVGACPAAGTIRTLGLLSVGS